MFSYPKSFLEILILHTKYACKICSFATRGICCCTIAIAKGRKIAVSEHNVTRA